MHIVHIVFLNNNIGIDTLQLTHISLFYSTNFKIFHIYIIVTITTAFEGNTSNLLTLVVLYYYYFIFYIHKCRALQRNLELQCIAFKFSKLYHVLFFQPVKLFLYTS